MAKTKPLRVSSRRATVPPDILRTRSESTLMGDLSLTVLIKLNFSFIAISSCWPQNLSQTGCLSAQGGVLPHIHRWIPLAPGKWIAAGPKLTAAGSGRMTQCERTSASNCSDKTHKGYSWRDQGSAGIVRKSVGRIVGRYPGGS